MKHSGNSLWLIFVCSSFSTLSFLITNCKSKLLAKIRAPHHSWSTSRISTINSYTTKVKHTFVLVDQLPVPVAHMLCTYIVSVESHRQKPCTMLTTKVICVHVRANVKKIKLHVRRKHWEIQQKLLLFQLLPQFSSKRKLHSLEILTTFEYETEIFGAARRINPGVQIPLMPANWKSRNPRAVWLAACTPEQ